MDLYYGPPDAERFCAVKHGLEDYRCPNPISFYVKIPDGRSDDWRKAWAACAEHLATVIWQMQEAYGPDGWSSSGQTLYTGEYQLRAEEL